MYIHVYGQVVTGRIPGDMQSPNQYTQYFTVHILHHDISPGLMLADHAR